MIRIAAFIAGIVVAAPALAQLAEPTLFSPVPLTAAEWGARPPAKKGARLAQDMSAQPVPAVVTIPPPPAVLPGAPSAQPTAMPAPMPQPAVMVQPAPAPTEPTQNSGAPTLRSFASVTSGIVRIGDLVENAGAVADIAIFRAPDLGQTGSVPAGRVVEAVRSHHIIALATGGIAEVMVTHASRVISAKEIEARIIRALAGQYGLSDARDLGIMLDSMPRALQVEATITAELAIARLSFDPRTRRFDVTFELAGSAAARRLPLRFAGVVVETTEAVVAVRPLAQGEVFKASDVMIERRPKAETGAAPIPTVEDVLGLAARRPLQPGKIIRHADLMKPELVARNDTVSITYEMPGMVLSVRGKAIEAGAKGDLISVLNVQSKRTVQATVAAPGRVIINNLHPQLAVNAAPAEQPNAQRNRAE